MEEAAEADEVVPGGPPCQDPGMTQLEYARTGDRAPTRLPDSATASLEMDHGSHEQRL